MKHSSDDGPVIVVERSGGGVGSFLLGVLVGGAVALLLAPHSGEETREVLRARARRLKEAAEATADAWQGRIEEGYETAKARVEEGFESARRTLKEKRASTTDAVEAGKAAVHSAREELDRRLAEARAARGKTRTPDSADA